MKRTSLGRAREPRSSGAPASVQPVLDAIARTAARLCEAHDALIHQVEGDSLRLVAKYGRLRAARDVGETFPLIPGWVAGRAVIDRKPVHVRDVTRARAFRVSAADTRARATRVRTILATPLVRDGAALGVIVILRTTVRPFTPKQIALLKTFADQAAIAIENARLSAELQGRNRELSEALERETATGEILRTISSSPTDVQPTLDAVAESAARLCGATDAVIRRVEDGRLRRVAQFGSLPVLAETEFFPLDAGTVIGQAVRERRAIHIHDMSEEHVRGNYPGGQATQQQIGIRTVLAVPLVKKDSVIGGIVIRRTEVSPFTNSQIALLQTFADQAVIAIENVRLFTELEARNRDLTTALDRQTATSEILRVISSSPTDVQPVFDVILQSAVKLCNSLLGTVVRVDRDLVRLVAVQHPRPEEVAAIYPLPLTSPLATCRAIRENTVVHVPDVESASAIPSVSLQAARTAEIRSLLVVPMRRDDHPIGAILIARPTVGPFPPEQIALLQTFADQAVIAIENVRLFKALEGRNRDLTEALDQQTATSEILRVISRSPSDVQPTFEAIAASAIRLCEAEEGTVFRFDGTLIHVAAHRGRAQSDLVRRVFPIPAGRGSVTARAVLTRTVVHVPDATIDPELEPSPLLAQGFRTVLSVPMLRDGEPVGAITVTRQKVAPFSNTQIALLQTFADQAVIAVENVRLFTELDARNRDLTEALDQQTATSEILRVIAGSPTDVQPVFAAVAASAARLCDAFDATIFQIDGDRLRVAVHDGPIASHPVGQGPSLARETPSGRAVLDRRTIHVADAQAETDEYPEGSEHARRLGFRTVLAVPLMREGLAIGVINLRRADAQLFTKRQVALLETFADQAVIAIENVRLFTELGSRNKELGIALEQQTATSELLKVIGRSTFDLQPVFETLAENAVRLCEAERVLIERFDGQVLRVVAARNVSPEHRAFAERNPIAPGHHSGAARAALERRTIHIHDVQADPEYTYGAKEVDPLRTLLAVPMLRTDELLGVILIYRHEVRPFSDNQIVLMETFADQAAIAIENARLLSELQAKNADLTEALEQQTATSEILRVISSSPTDIQPVLDVVAESAARLCRSFDCDMFRLDGDRLVLVAHHGPTPGGVVGEFTRPLVRGSVAGRTALEGRTIHVADVQAEAEEFPESAPARTFGLRTMLSVPLIREGAVVGVIQLERTEVNPFTDRQAELLKIFADQAVIAIENVRLFKELDSRNRDLSEALEQQTATSEILRVISSSPTGVQPTFDAIAAAATSLCEADNAGVFRFDGHLVHFAAQHGRTPEEIDAAQRAFPQPPHHGSVTARALLSRDVVQIADVGGDPDVAEPLRIFRTVLSVPMLRDGQALGAITVARRVVRPFTDGQVALLKTFADQAVIAIENVRLFKELETRNRALTEALDQQTATSEILRVISSSPTDLQPVFDSIAASATRLCEALYGLVFRFDGEMITLVAHDSATPEQLSAIRRVYPMPPGGRSVAARTIQERRVIAIADSQTSTEYTHIAERARAIGYRSLVSVPMLRGGAAIGAINVVRAEATPFTDAQIELLKTFADQAVIAIENVRLFTELQARTAQLTRSVDELTALGEVSRALSSTLDLETVLNTIVARANQLAGTDACSVWEYDETTETFHLRATDNLDQEVVAILRRTAIGKGEGAVGRMAITQAPVQIPDIATEDAYRGSMRDVLVRTGTRALLAVPLLRDERLVGGLTVNKKTPGEFAPETVELLKTFATQSALAINNARLFREIEEKGRQLEIASQHKSQFLANMSHELRTPLNAILGYTELIADGIYGEVPERMGEVLERVDKSGRHLLGLINDILDLSKIEAGQLTLALGPYAMDGVAQTVATQVGALAAEKQLGFEVVLPEDLPIGQGDERRLTQVLLNLVGNAIKFTDTGKVVVRVGTSDAAYVVSVTDTGPGIAEADREKIFEEFQQADTTRTKAKGGTGLGLAISRRIVEMHGGRLWVESTLGEGSTFSFTVPVHVEHQVAVTRQGAPR